MTPSDQRAKPDTSKSALPLGGATTLPGGYHSRGVPGEEGDVRKRMRVLKVGDRSQINKSRPLMGGAGAEHASAARLDAGRNSPAVDGSSAFVIVKKGAILLDTPVFRAGEMSDEEAVAIFTGRDLAQHYLDQAAWTETDEIGELSPGDLHRWLLEAEREGVQYAAINPDRERHLAGDPQVVLSLDALGEESVDSLHRQVAELARS